MKGMWLRLLVMTLMGAGLVVSWSCDNGGDRDSDSDGDSDSDRDSDSDVEPGTCEEPPLAQGVLHNDVADIDFSGEEVHYTIEHKLDIDPEEDGCIAYAEFAVRKAGLGCELRLVFGVPGGGGPMSLLDASLSADSFCPGWLDADEGDYHMMGGTPVFTFVSRVPERTAEQSCIGDAAASFEGVITLQDGGRTLEIDLGDITFFGDFLSFGNTELACPCWPSCGDLECGSDPNCGWPCGECGAEERCSDTGVCECAPNCGDRECGMDPVCEILDCGVCESIEICTAEGVCECVPECDDRECGLDPVCDVLACGVCPADHECNPSGMCDCIPNCGSRECGMDPICGTLSCGSCGGDVICSPSGYCDCAPECGRRECGMDPVCGTLACGTCEEDEVCSDSGICVCVPVCGARECGMDPVCGTLSCGSCGPSEECSPSGRCDCVPDCGGRECGMDPVCGSLSCGSCGVDERCNDRGGCECDPDCGWRECGRDPVCGTLSCGSCGVDEVCNASGTCDCVPDCGGRECGLDPVCGTLSCGSCDTDERCNASGTCECSPDCGGRECGLDPVCGTLSCGSCGCGWCNARGRCEESPGGICCDTYSGLCWQDPPAEGEDTRQTWDEAVAYCDDLDLGGHGPGSWHLPTISELRLLLRGCPATETGGACGVTDDCLAYEDCWSDPCRGCRALEGPGAEGAYWPEEFVSGSVVGSYWSSSSYAGTSSLAWFVHFFSGLVRGVDKTHILYVRCVRAGP